MDYIKIMPGTPKHQLQEKKDLALEEAVFRTIQVYVQVEEKGLTEELSLDQSPAPPSAHPWVPCAVSVTPLSEMLSCDHTQEVRVHYILKPEAVGEQKEIVFYYLVMAKGGIVRAGTQALAVEHGDVNGTFSLMLPVESDIAPLAQMLIYTISPNQEPIADSVKFQVENCFANKVDLHFSPAEGLPASDTRLRVGASPGSLCAVCAVDKSVLLMKPEAELSPSSVYNLLSVKELQGYHHGADMLPMDPQEECIAAEKIIVNGVTYASVSEPDEEDTYSILKEMGLKVFTNSKVRKPHYCLQFPQVAWGYRSSEGFHSEAEVSAQALRRTGHARVLDSGYPVMAETLPAAVETVRKYFPETWIWDLVPLTSNGSAELPLTIPDTITEWKANAFCTSSDTGFGLSPTVSLRALQPFFVELTLPYSVVHGEAFTLKATVFNYLTRCIRVSISLASSADFRATPVEKEEDSYCLCVNGRKTVSWAVTPISLGNVNFSVSAEALKTELPCENEVAVLPETGQKDTVIKQLLVEPEGIETEATFNSLLCANGNSEAGKISLKLPLNVVQGSARAYVTVLGDILGTAMQNLQQLLQMPFGCGEQNMVLFAPNIYVLDYLNKTGQLSEETKSKAIGYLVSGYQRQLNYKHLDGSYSTFGEHYRQLGNTWLTAFVLKSFAQARSHIFIEEKHIQDALAWLAGKQKENGCFRSSGTLLNNAIKGGVDDEVTLSAYITIALLEIPLPITKWLIHSLGHLGPSLVWQDTVVALQALSRYGASTYTKSGGASTVTLQSTGNFQSQFQVDHTIRLLLQRMALPEVPGDYRTGVTGEGCVYVQTSLRYNMLPKPEEAPFALEVHTVPETCDSPQVHRTFSIAINISYTGKRPVSNMVIVDVKMLSGFIPVKSSVRKLEGHHHIHRTELSTNHVLLYMEQVSNVTQSFSFVVEQDFPVQSLKPAVVKVYDYYETDEFAIAEYSAPCSKANVEQENA
ncbi:alpha-2-macroglobulin-like [Malaclemys terrapin pileata]|uniref:alpha-2-macroglobulin-like n=1 Tax=Malaclemys terrapin pileata TaxID=2991368 RepID=UPI0023A86B2A|nr:alpha-2-macroglobulin-like [Malaclemys terrapin pileata]